MKFWRLASNDPAIVEAALNSGQWRSKVDRDLRALSVGDRLVFFCTSGKTPGYLGIGTLTGGLSTGNDPELPFQVTFDADTRLKQPLKQDAVRKTLQAARLRIRYQPLFVLELSAAEFQVMSRMITQESRRTDPAAL